jgi:hypothetical protein
MKRLINIILLCSLFFALTGFSGFCTKDARWAEYSRGVLATARHFFLYGNAPSRAFQRVAFIVGDPQTDEDVEFINAEAEKRSSLGSFNEEGLEDLVLPSQSYNPVKEPAKPMHFKKGDRVPTWMYFARPLNSKSSKDVISTFGCDTVYYAGYIYTLNNSCEGGIFNFDTESGDQMQHTEIGLIGIEFSAQTWEEYKDRK